MSKLIILKCDICDKATGSDFHYRFKYNKYEYRHPRVGTFHKFYMCPECYKKFVEFAKKAGKTDD